jgi:hypothetical protein
LLKHGMFNLKRKSAGVYTLYFENGVIVGDVMMKEDGYYDWWPELSDGGCLAAHFLRGIADLLDELNAPWDRNIDAYFSGHQES